MFGDCAKEFFKNRRYHGKQNNRNGREEEKKVHLPEGPEYETLIFPLHCFFFLMSTAFVCYMLKNEKESIVLVGFEFES